VIQRRTRALERVLDDLEAAPGLGRGIARPTVFPSRSGAVPDTAMIDPTRTAREIPTFGSYGLPLEMSCLMVAITSKRRA
jgi:hypothetical protein